MNVRKVGNTLRQNSLCGAERSPQSLKSTNRIIISLLMRKDNGLRCIEHHLEDFLDAHLFANAKVHINELTKVSTIVALVPLSTRVLRPAQEYTVDHGGLMFVHIASLLDIGLLLEANAGHKWNT